MSPVEVRTLLSGAAALDRFLASTPPEMAAEMETGWAGILRDVPLGFAQSVIRGHYSVADVRTVTPGDIMGAWTAERRRTAQAATDAELRAAEAPNEAQIGARAVQEAIPAGGAMSYLRDLAAALDAGRPASSVPRPAGVRVLSPKAEEISRRCRFPDLCVCTHTECRDGWVDEPVDKVNALGMHYEAAARCPQCYDALQMAETTGRLRKPRRAGR